MIISRASYLSDQTDITTSLYLFVVCVNIHTESPRYTYFVGGNKKNRNGNAYWCNNRSGNEYLFDVQVNAIILGNGRGIKWNNGRRKTVSEKKTQHTQTQIIIIIKTIRLLNSIYDPSAPVSCAKVKRKSSASSITLSYSKLYNKALLLLWTKTYRNTICCCCCLCSSHFFCCKILSVRGCRSFSFGLYCIWLCSSLYQCFMSRFSDYIP